MADSSEHTRGEVAFAWSGPNTIELQADHPEAAAPVPPLQPVMLAEDATAHKDDRSLTPEGIYDLLSCSCDEYIPNLIY